MKRLLCALICLCGLFPAGAAEADFSEYEVESASASLSSYQAGEHADFTVAFSLKTELEGGEIAQTRDISVALPPGLLGDPTAVPACTMQELGHDSDSTSCPQDSQVGIAELQLQERSGPVREPIYNMTPPGGDSVARLGMVVGFYPIVIDVKVRSEDDYGATATIKGAAAGVGLLSAVTTIWGVPGSSEHDGDRITPPEGEGSKVPPPGGRSSDTPPAPFLSNPTSCGMPLQVVVSASSYQLPQSPSSKVATMGAIAGCSKLSFKPSFTSTPTSREAGSPTGLDIALDVPQNEHPTGRVTSHIKDAEVTFPPGMTLSPGAADGLEACSAAQAGYHSRNPASCPSASKLGTAEFDVPALQGPLEGGIYQRTPEPGHLFRVWLVADGLGVHVSLPGEIELDPDTGRISTKFLDNPQVPLRSLRLHLFGGQRGPLVNPARCGTYQTAWSLTPWSGGAVARGDAPMVIEEGCDEERFDPQLDAGTTTARAGSFAPFVLRMTKGDGSANISKFDVTLPPGVLAKLAGVELCPEAAVATAGCTDASRIGSLKAAVGPGTNPLSVPQPGKAPAEIFLGGPYRGAPYSMITRVPAQAGPFDLGTVVVRAAVRVDPASARVSVDSDPLPQFLEGVPLSYRAIAAIVDRPRFTLNPTSCERHEVQAQVTSIAGDIASPSSRFRATSCGRLGFRPRLKLAVSGSTKRTGHPAMKASLVARAGDANLRRVAVILPSSLLIDNAHISNPCTRVQFASEDCPPKSVLGVARAKTPLLDKALKGKVYFRSNGGARPLPDMVLDLRGSIRIVLVGRIDSVVKNSVGRIRTTFAAIPDAPVERVSLNLFGGDRGLLVNGSNLCAAPPRANVQIRAQNGKVRNSTQAIEGPCNGHR